mmetsp:Transcript_40365/g.59865  ORF Transcript_40365/g.59865 Transcript_40365/m.59865 type:complete len:208 (-) Transcript_40365:2339-2962(-)
MTTLSTHWMKYGQNTTRVLRKTTNDLDPQLLSRNTFLNRLLLRGRMSQSNNLWYQIRHQIHNYAQSLSTHSFLVATALMRSGRSQPELFSGQGYYYPARTDERLLELAKVQQPLPHYLCCNSLTFWLGITYVYHGNCLQSYFATVNRHVPAEGNSMTPRQKSVWKETEPWSVKPLLMVEQPTASDHLRTGFPPWNYSQGHSLPRASL